MFTKHKCPKHKCGTLCVTAVSKHVQLSDLQPFFYLFFFDPLLPLYSFFKEGVRVWKSLAPGNSGVNPDPSILVRSLT